MGNIFHDIFGGSSSSQKSESGDYAYPTIQSDFGPVAAGAAPAFSQYAGILGLNGQPANAQALNDYWNSAGGQFQLGQGLDALISKYAAEGLAKSGAAMKGMEQYRQGLASTYLNNYLGNLSSLLQSSEGAGGLLSDAGRYSTGKSNNDSETGAFGTFLGALLASDIRLKERIERVGTLPDGLPVYDFDYRRDIDPSLPQGRQRGVMAHEVAVLQPWALGPQRNGYATVDYSRLRTAPDEGQIARWL